MSGPIAIDKAFLLLCALVTIAFAIVLWPFYGAIFWAVVLSILFAPIQKRHLKLSNGRPNIAALGTLLVVLLLVILPSAVISSMLFREAADTYKRFQSGELSIGRYFEQLWTAAPDWLTGALDRAGLANLADVKERMTMELQKNMEFLSGQVLSFGQGTLYFLVSFFVMLYLLFFLVRDGKKLAAKIRNALPLDETLVVTLEEKFTTVIRATIKGGVIVAIVQGALGGAMFWFLGIQAPVLWGVVMAFLSLLPALGTGLIWGPAAIYLLLSGQQWQGITLIVFGVLVIGLVDNILRPLLVGKDTRMPDWVVFISTLGGVVAFGPNGFVVGPVIAALFIAVWEAFSETRSRAAPRTAPQPQRRRRRGPLDPL